MLHMYICHLHSQILLYKLYINNSLENIISDIIASLNLKNGLDRMIQLLVRQNIHI